MLIIDMPMPTCCARCFLADENDRCSILGTVATQKGRMPNCPIKGVLPDEHGDLIDADAIYKRAGQKKGEADPLALARELWSAPVIVAAERKDDD